MRYARRYSNDGTIVNLKGQELKTFYYTPFQIKRIFSKYFDVNAVKPVGFFIPPSYLENFFSNKRKTFNLIKKLEYLISNFSILAPFSDHFLIDLQVKTDLIPKQGIFFEDQVYDAYEFVSKIFASAEKSICIIDNYIDDTVLTHLKKRNEGVKVQIFTNKIPKELKLEADKFEDQYGAIELFT